MPQYNITLKDQNATPEQVEAEKQKIVDKGGKVLETYSLIKGFLVEFPEDQVSVLQSDDKLDVESNGEVSTN